jgi:hypothetical protein
MTLIAWDSSKMFPGTRVCVDNRKFHTSDENPKTGIYMRNFSLAFRWPNEQDEKPVRTFSSEEFSANLEQRITTQSAPWTWPRKVLLTTSRELLHQHPTKDSLMWHKTCARFVAPSSGTLKASSNLQRHNEVTTRFSFSSLFRLDSDKCKQFLSLQNLFHSFVVPGDERRPATSTFEWSQLDVC